MKRTYLVTGAASGIGAATADRLAGGSARVIRCDLHDADVVADLTTESGRGKLVADVETVTGGVLDGVVAVAGIGDPDPSTEKSQPIGFSGDMRGTITAPTLEKPTENKTFSAQKE
jgi:NAD(P)-dependent dehydrogenase (short-subunit alcohol dehydrogenase family)